MFESLPWGPKSYHLSRHEAKPVRIQVRVSRRFWTIKPVGLRRWYVIIWNKYYNNIIVRCWNTWWRCHGRTELKLLIRGTTPELFIPYCTLNLSILSYHSNLLNTVTLKYHDDAGDDGWSSVSASWFGDISFAISYIFGWICGLRLRICLSDNLGRDEEFLWWNFWHLHLSVDAQGIWAQKVRVTFRV